jgi:hypothetical protein
MTNSLLLESEASVLLKKNFDIVVIVIGLVLCILPKHFPLRHSLILTSIFSNVHVGAFKISLLFSFSHSCYFVQAAVSASI